MKPQFGQNLECPSFEIAAYIDGELDRAREFELEDHFAACEICAQELNHQKQFLCDLNSSLKHEGDLELPPNFTKLIVANAESTVSGLRRPRERFNAVFICAGLALFVLFALGADVFKGVSGIFDQMSAVVGFFGHLFYSIFVGVAIIVRSFAAQFRLDIVMAVVLIALFTVSLMYASRKMLRIRRA